MKVGQLYGVDASMWEAVGDGFLTDILSDMAEAQGEVWAELLEAEQMAALEELKSMIRGKLQ